MYLRYTTFIWLIMKRTRGAKSASLVSESQFAINFEVGNILLIIDGLDQVVSRLGSGFPVDSLMESIYAGDPASRNRKVIITCRSEFLPESYFTHQVTPVEVLPFDTAQAEAFLSKRFPDMPRVVARGLELASQLTRDEGSEHFYPFLLDIVVTLLRDKMSQNFGSKDDSFEFNAIPKESILTDQNDNDWMIYRICAREFEKYTHGLDPEGQISCMLSLAVDYRGIVLLDDLPRLVERAAGPNLVSGQAEALLAHPLLRTDDRSVGFRYDVVREHFRSVQRKSPFPNTVIAFCPSDLSTCRKE